MSTRLNIISKILLIVLAFLLSAGDSQAQWDEFDNGKSFGFGAGIRATGLGLTISKSFNELNAGYTPFVIADFYTAKHPAEMKVLNQGAQSPRPFVYGKLNHAFMTRLGLGLNKKIIQRSTSNSIGLSVEGHFGVNLGSLRPVYLDVMTYKANDKTPIIRSQRYDPDIHTNQSDIVGYSRRSDSWGEVSHRLGAQATLSARLDWGRYSHVGKQISAGLMIDYFPNSLPIMANRPNPNILVNPFVRFMWYFSRA